MYNGQELYNNIKRLSGITKQLRREYESKKRLGDDATCSSLLRCEDLISPLVWAILLLSHVYIVSHVEVVQEGLVLSPRGYGCEDLGM